MYCRMEVEAAAEFKRNVVIALKEGSNWEDACPSEGLEKLEPEARPIFNKANCIKHYTVGQHLQEFRREVLSQFVFYRPPRSPRLTASEPLLSLRSLLGFDLCEDSRWPLP